ncbi:MAG TPA: DUF2130 domain-containing protein, partial [Terracidiphilus sp.]|nr:DUF2130 domain-containing protein [Terracidiphilus sp.]
MANEFSGVTCPKCGEVFALDVAALAGPLLEATKKQAAEDLAAANRRADDAVTKARIEAAASGKIAAKAEAAEEIRAAQQKAEEAVNAQVGLRAQLSAADMKLAEAQKVQAEALRKERELADRERELELTVERRIGEGVGAARDAARRDADEANRLKLLEKDTLLESMQKKVEELNQKITQGSQQTQGEVQELDLEAKLRAAFPFDSITEVAKGVNGADCSQVVASPTGAHCGLILWESKRTKNWSDGWLPKLREDGRKAQADLLVIVSQTLPEELSAASFGCIDSVWVCAPLLATTLALALRATLLAVHNTKQVQAGMLSKSEEVYAYVTGPQFRHRVEALVEAFTAMNEDLAAEQKSMQRQWAKRATQIERILTSTTGMF